MNTQAAFKALAVVLAIGALTGFNEWRRVYGVPPEVRAQRDIAQCVKDRQGAAFRENPLKFGHNVTQQNQQFDADCRAQQGGGLHYSPSGQVQTQSREQCLTQLDEARKRSPHGLAPEWEKTQKARCDGLYSEAASQ